MNEVLKTQKVYLDVKKPTAQPQDIKPIKVGDTGNVFEIELVDDGAAVDLADCIVLAIFARADGKLAQQDVDTGMTVSGNVITLKLRSTSYTYGQNKCDIQVYSGLNNATLVTSAEFYFDGARGILNDETIETEENFPVLVGLIERVEALGKRTGDMEKATYDKDGSGIVDDAEKLGGKEPDHYATAQGLADAVAGVTPSAIGAERARLERTATLQASAWVSNAQTISVSGVTVSSLVVVSAAPASHVAYGEAGVYCSVQAEGSLTFSCSDVPTEDLSVNVVIWR